MESAKKLKESLQKSQTVTDAMLTVLGSFDRCLSSLDSAMRPTQVKTDEIRKAHENIEKTLKAAEAVLTHYDISHQVKAQIMKGPHADLNGFIMAVEKLQKTLDFFTSTGKLKSTESTIYDTHELLSKAMYKLEEEFKQLLAEHSKFVEPEQLISSLPSTKRHSTVARKSSSSLVSLFHPSYKKTENGSKVEVAPVVLPTLIPTKVVTELYEIALCMVNGGHYLQCTKIYREIRSSCLNQTLQKFGVEKFSKEDLQKLSCESLERKIGTWIQCLRVAVKILYTTEQMLCNQLFYQLDPYRECCFAEVIESSMKLLLNFGEATVKSKKSPEKLFMLLDMYDAMYDLLPEVKALFGAKASAECLSSFEELMKRLGQTACNTLDEFGEAVEKDATKAAIHDGTVHPLTSYVINYVKFLFGYKTTLELLFEDVKKDDLSSKICHIVSILLTNLEGKSKQYKDPALMHLFLMNNIHYIVKSVRKSEARNLLGEDWVQRHRRLVQQHASGYQRTSWGKVLQYISWQGLAASGNAGIAESSTVSRSLLKERFKIFNQCFEELYQKQTQWIVPDVELRESLRLAVAEVLLPAYRSYVKRFGAPIQSGRNPNKYIKYMPEDLEQKLSDFFEGVPKGNEKR